MKATATVVLGAALLVTAACGADDAKQALLERVFGEAARLDPELVARVKALPPGKRLLVDRDGDGKHDEAWFLDTARRHTIRPLLVRAIDEDGDLDKHGGPDLDSDLYLADWRADGTIDSAIDYQDNDGDGDVDEMAVYYFVGRKSDTLMCWWGRDVGDDNLLWYDVNWTYSQGRCQYRSHFSGDELFCAFHLRQGSDRWQSVWENPFVFYDPDRDGSAEVTARFEGRNDAFTSLRYSFDADGDAWGRRAYDYDFSITAISSRHPWLRGKAKPGAAVTLTDDVASPIKLRGIPTHRVLRWDAAQRFAREAPWARACLTWDEMNANTEGNVRRDPHERWEGIIAHGSKDFPQIGGPPCSRLNKRVEVSLKPARPLRLYHDPTDHRLHLLGAREGWLDVDYDLDGKPDARYTWADLDGDGILDRRRIDLDADGTTDFDWPMAGKGVHELKLDYAPLSAFYQKELAAVLRASQEFIDAAKGALPDRSTKPDPVETFFLAKLASWQPQTRLGHRMRSTPAGARLYLDLLRDRLFHALRGAYAQSPRWKEIEDVYAAGRYGAAAELVTKMMPGKGVATPARFGAFSHRIPIRIANSGGPAREHWPVVVRVKELAKDFNPDNCAVVAPDRWIDWRELPHQVDLIDPMAGKELSFLVNAPAEASATWYVYYSPTGTRSKPFPPRTATAEDWVPPNIGWESTRAGYRAYWGQLDFFGKREYRHSRRFEYLLYPGIKGIAYHKEQAWGIDALHVGKASGLGGLTLYAGERAHLVQNPAGKGSVRFAKRMLTSGPVRAAVEITAANILPDKPALSLRILCIIYAERQESEIRVSASAPTDGLSLAPGLVKLPREQHFLDRPHGCLGAWGSQEDAIGEVGMSVIVPPGKLKQLVDLRDERRLRCDFSGGTLRYWIIGDWRRGRRFPVAPTIENWRREMRALATRLHRDVQVTVGSSEQVR